MAHAAACAALLALLLSITPSARQAQAPPQFRGGIELVQVDVSVLDKDRRPVRGLTAADFTVLEDGKSRPIAAFTPVDLADAPPPADSATATWMRDVPRDVVTNDVGREGRLVVIVLDRTIRFEDATLARRIATRAVDELGPNDLAALIFTSQFSNGGKAVDFTSDRARLRAAIQQPFAVMPHAFPNDLYNANKVMLLDPDNLKSGDCLCGLCVIETMTRVADVVRDVPGRRKSMLFIGTYLRLHDPLKPIPRGGSGRPTFVEEPAHLVQNSGAAPCSAPLSAAREKLDRAAALANLTIHTIDPVGLETAANSPLGGDTQGIRVRQAHLPEVADLTGGRTVMNTNAPEAALPAIFAESRAYYLLGFEPALRRDDGKLHRVEVKVRGRDLTVRGPRRLLRKRGAVRGGDVTRPGANRRGGGDHGRPAEDQSRAVCKRRVHRRPRH